MIEPIPIQSINDTLVCDSRDVARELGIKHDNFMQTIETHKATIQEHFGVILFQTGKPQGGIKGGRPIKFCLLTEDQFIFIATLSRNTVKVVEVKAMLVKAFSFAKRALQSNVQSRENTTIPELTVRHGVNIAIDRLIESKDYNDAFKTFLFGIDFIKQYQDIVKKREELDHKESSLALSAFTDRSESENALALPVTSSSHNLRSVLSILIRDSQLISESRIEHRRCLKAVKEAHITLNSKDIGAFMISNGYKKDGKFWIKT